MKKNVSVHLSTLNQNSLPATCPKTMRFPINTNFKHDFLKQLSILIFSLNININIYPLVSKKPSPPKDKIHI